LVAFSNKCLYKVQAYSLTLAFHELSPVNGDLCVSVQDFIKVNELIVLKIIEHLEVHFKT